MKVLIVNADDFGRSRGINAGVMRAHREGIVTATTLMANGPEAAEAGRLARADPSLDVGVHLVVTYGRPLVDPGTVRSLVDAEGRFPRRPEAIVGMARADADEALREFRAQYDRVRALVGREPTHLDSHHWAHDEPALERAIAALGRETGAAVRPHDDAQRDRLRAAGARTVDRYRRDFQHPGHIDLASLERIFETIGEGATELGCHPGEPDAELAATSAYAAPRADELTTLTDPRARAALQARGIVLATYAEVGSSAGRRAPSGEAR